MLLINDNYAKAVELDALLNQSVSANNNVDTTARQVAQHLSALFARHSSRQQFNPQWSVTKKILRIGHLQIANKLFNPCKMLFGQHFGWRHNCTLMPPLHSCEHCSNRNNGFTATDISLQQSMHWMWSCKIGSDFADHSALCASETKWESSNKSVNKFI